MSQPPPPPRSPLLTPQLCFNQTALRDFLRLSRATTDDSITQNLNGLLTPSRPGFDPTSTSPSTSRPVPTHRALIPSTTCSTFVTQILFPTWHARSSLLTYCARVATSPDPNDPDLLLREIESARDRERVVNERLDPYSGRFFPREARTEALANTVRNERAVEGIVRRRTWAVVGERCSAGEDGGGGFQAGGWEEAFERWRVEQEGKERER